MVNDGRATAALSQAAIGRALNLSPASMTKLKKQGMPVDSVESSQAWRMATQNVAIRKPSPFDSVAASVGKNSNSLMPTEGAAEESHNEARTRREIAEADLAELKLSELRGELVRAAAVRAALSKKAAALRESFLQLPARMVPLLAADPTPASMDRILRAEIVTALAQLSEAE